MKAYLILDLKVTDFKIFKEYIEKIPSFIKQYEDQYLVQGVVPEVIEGDWCPERVVIIEFPSKENAKGFLNDSGAKTLFAIRHKSTVSQLILAEGCC